jgi:hypothetical protein
MHRSDILGAADSLINGDREKTYGPPIVNFTRIAKGWSVILDREVRPHEVALCMDWVKTCRAVETPTHMDSYIDGAGYKALAGELAEIQWRYRPGEETIPAAMTVAEMTVADMCGKPEVPGFEYSGTSFIDPEADGPTDFGR